MTLVQFADERAVEEVLDSLRAKEASKKAWQRAGISFPGLILRESNGFVACLMSEGTEPCTGGRSYRLHDFVATEHRSPSEHIAKFRRFVENQAPTKPGWIAVEASDGSDLEDALSADGFKAVTLDLKLCWEKPVESPPAVSTATTEDARHIRSLSAECLTDVIPYPPGAQQSQVLNYTKNHWPSYSQECDLNDPMLKFLVSRDEQDRFQGFISLALFRPEPWIDDLAVAPSARGGKTARALLQAAQASCQGEGKSVLNATIALTNPRSWKPALRVGFQPIRRRWMREVSSSIA